MLSPISPPPDAIQTAVANYFAATRTMDVDAWLLTFAPDAISHEPVGGTPLQGHAALRQYFQSVMGLFDTIGLTEEFVHIAKNQAAVKWVGRGVGKTGKSITFEGIDLFEVNEDGQIQTLWGYWNPAAMMADL